MTHIEGPITAEEQRHIGNASIALYRRSDEVRGTPEHATIAAEHDAMMRLRRRCDYLEKTRGMQIQHMVNRFLQWKLPANFMPDGGISFAPEFNKEFNARTGQPPQRHEPSGTNLFDADQAAAMVAFMIEGMPAANAASQIDRLAQFIMSEVPGEPSSQSEGAVDCAIRWMRERLVAAEREPATTAEFVIKTVQEAFGIVPRNAPPIPNRYTSSIFARTHKGKIIDITTSSATLDAWRVAGFNVQPMSCDEIARIIGREETSEQVAKAALSALRGLYDEVAEISQRNNLGAMNNTTMKAARKELGLPTEWTEAQREYPVSVPVKQRRIIHIVFRQHSEAPGSDELIGSHWLEFIDVHNEAGESINAGEWTADSNGYEALIIDLDNVSLSHVPPMQKPAAPDPLDELEKLFADKPFNADKLREFANKGGLTGVAQLTVTPSKPDADGPAEHRQTFEVPPGHVALRDEQGRATGKTAKIEQYSDIAHEFEPDLAQPAWCAHCGYNKSARVHNAPFGRKLTHPEAGSPDRDKPHKFDQSPLAGYCKCGREKASPMHERTGGGG